MYDAIGGRSLDSEQLVAGIPEWNELQVYGVIVDGASRCTGISRR